ncbi:hypoxanthine phosphoribosyltransferase [Wenyingzhuangia heitensis]|uniref:Hypoxanthine phosphoribosyltransferase n=1 Tax=Wenyingzhuangia heitensis TaxID=1487859 RepID=A0ABX0U4P6_9FLAO|nr:hypoxanthine phosphoribosyltransferase [Wenyingzhuangia heitensis]NIJ43767.1 hypoxanthine phosphoribosyltransferase [Wenyingzhuangia heitensis]
MDIKLHNKTFEPYISSNTIAKAVSKVADEISKDYQNEIPLFLGVLNGSFMFCTDLLKQYNHSCEISFIKLASYQQTSSTGIVNQLIGLNEDLTNRTVIIVEDIVDTGNTLEKIVSLLKEHPIKEFKAASLFLKPTVYNKSIPIDYVGLEIPNDFILGYGLDYDGLGRNLAEIYKLKEK